MTTSLIIKPEQKRLNRSIHTGVGQTNIRINLAPRPEIVLSSRVRCPNNGTMGPRGLIGAQNSGKVGGRTFYLGNVSLYSLLDKLSRLSRACPKRARGNSDVVSASRELKPR